MPPASPVLLAQGPGPAAGEGRDRNRAGGPGSEGVGASRPLPGLCFPVPGRRAGRAAALPPRRRAAASPCPGPPGGVSACRIPRGSCGEDPIGALGQCFFVTQGGLSAFATVEGRSEEGTVSSLIRSRKSAQARASALCRVASLNCLAALRK